MNVISNESKEAVTASESTGMSSAIAARRRRRWVVNTLRILILLANARILGASQRQLSTAVIIPSALTWIIASLHTSFSFALVGAVVGEYLGATQGIGLMIQTAQGAFNANGVFAAMVMLAALALLAELLITALENRLIGWRPNTINDMAI
jgi:NitT/TauT family transport system permease protein